MIQRIHGKAAWVLLAGAGLIVGVIAGAVSLFGDVGSAQSVRVRDGDVVVVTGSVDEALAEASRRAGFSIVAPAAGSMSGVRLEGVLIPAPPPPGPPGSPPRTFRVVTLDFAVGDTNLQLDETNEEVDPSFAGDEMPAGLPGARLFRESTDGGTTYSLLVGQRGFLLGIPRGANVSESVALELLRRTAAKLK